MSYSWYASGAPGATVEPSFWPVHFRNRKLAQRGLVSGSGIGYPASSIGNCSRSTRELLPDTILRLGSSISTACLGAGCAVLLAWGTVSAQTNSQSPAPKTQAKSAAKLQKASASSTSRKSKKSRKSASWRRGQQKIDATRCREIQESLIREHYLDGVASGTWDNRCQSAMQRYQADNGWQSTVDP